MSTLPQTAIEGDFQLVEFICFTLGDQEFGIPITQVKEIIVPPPITRVVHTPALIKGVINIRGVIIAVLDIKQLFSVESIEIHPDRQRIIIVSTEEKTAGFLVDSIEVLKTAKNSEISKLESSAEATDSFSEGVIQLFSHPLTVLSVPKIINCSELKKVE